MPLAAAIASGLVAALLYLSVLTGSLGALILVYLVQLPLFAAGLSLGAKAALVAGGTATLVTGLTSGTLSGLLFFIAEALPAMLLVVQALRWREDESGAVAWCPPDRLVLWLTGIGVVALIAAALWLSGTPEGFRGTVHGFLAGQVDDLLGAASGTGGAADQKSRAELIDTLSAFFPAMAAGSWLIMSAINGILAQGALARFGLALRPAPDIATLVLPRWPAALLALALLVAFVASGDLAYLAGNLVPVLAIPYFFAGLAVLHALARRHAGRIFILVPAYLTLLLGWPVVLVAACGMIDQCLGLRQRFAASLPRQGE
jgi:Predicted membrane protein (DUF2232)